MKLTGLVLVFPLILSVTILFHLAYGYTTKFTKEITIVDKYQVTHRSYDYDYDYYYYDYDDEFTYSMVRDSDNNEYMITNPIWYNSPTEIKPNNRYLVEGYGYKYDSFSLYPHIYNVKLVK